MAYYLMVEKKRGEYMPLDITKSKCFTRLSNLKSNKANLNEIDLFTMMFNDNMELRKSLINEGILDANDSNRELSIRRIEKGKYIKVPYGFLYQSDIEYVMDPKRLIRRINDKLLNNDFRYIERFANNYLDYHECSSTSGEVKMAALDSARINGISKYFNMVDQNNDKLLIRMLKLLIYEHYQLPSGKVIYKDKIIYRNLHSLIAFTDYYDLKYMDEEKEQYSLFINDSKTLKRKKQIDGQYCLF